MAILGCTVVLLLARKDAYLDLHQQSLENTSMHNLQAKPIYVAVLQEPQVLESG